MDSKDLVDPEDIVNLFKSIQETLHELQIKWALIGGLAVSTHANPRFTNDIDLSVSATSDKEVEHIVFQLQQRKWKAEHIFEDKEKNYISTVRFTHPQHPDIFIDLLFASSGIETEIVEQALSLEAIPDVEIKVAQIGHLLALKILSEAPGREQDTLDIRALLQEANDIDIKKAKEACVLITSRGFHRERNLLELLEQHLTINQSNSSV